MAATAASSYPARLTFEAPLEVARWRPLVAWLLAIPHFAIAYVLRIVGGLVTVVSWFAIIFTGKDIEGLVGMRCMFLRYELRAGMYAGFLYEAYPPFSFETTAADPGDLAPARMDYQPALEGRNRVTVFFRVLLAIPHLIAMWALGIVAGLAYIVAFFAVLFTGAWPEGLRAFVVKVLKWNVRLGAYLYLLTDEYPPFELG